VGFILTEFSETLPFVLVLRFKRGLRRAELANRRMLDHQQCIQI
jgi:hypothetical protein